MKFLSKRFYIFFLLMSLGVAYEIIKEKNSNLGVTYEIIAEKDVSLGDQKRRTYRIAVSKTIKEKEIRPLVKKIVKDIDRQKTELTLWLYSDKDIAGGDYGYDVAMVEWKDDKYLSFNIKENLNEYLKQRNASEVK